MSIAVPSTHRRSPAKASTERGPRNVAAFDLPSKREYSPVWAKCWVVRWYDHNAKPRVSQAFGSLAMAEAYRQDLALNGIGSTVEPEN